MTLEIILLWVGVAINAAGISYNVGLYLAERRYRERISRIETKIAALKHMMEETDDE